MKTLQTLITRTACFLAVLMTIFTVACSAEDGMDGAIGPEGPQGIAGVDGQDGADGLDGNANVTAHTFDASTFSGTFDGVSLSALTQEVIDTYAILSYLQEGSSQVWFPVPCPADDFGFPHAVDVNIGLGGIDFDYADASGVPVSISAGDLVKGRVILIEPTSVDPASRVNNSSLSVLKEAGVDVNDYYAVCDYYGLSY